MVGWPRGCIWQRRAGALHRKGAVYSIDHAAELDNGTVADQLDDAAVVGGDGWAEDGLSVPLQSSQRARLVGPHQSRIADHVSNENGSKPPFDTRLGHKYRPSCCDFELSLRPGTKCVYQGNDVAFGSWLCENEI